jgi:hypothetical protein
MSCDPKHSSICLGWLACGLGLAGREIVARGAAWCAVTRSNHTVVTLTLAPCVCGVYVCVRVQGTQVWVPSGERGSTDWVFAEVVEDVEEGAKEALVALEDDTGRVITAQDPDTGEYKVRLCLFPCVRACGVCVHDAYECGPHASAAQDSQVREGRGLHPQSRHSRWSGRPHGPLLHARSCHPPRGTRYAPAAAAHPYLYLSLTHTTHTSLTTYARALCVGLVQLYLRYRVDMIYSYSGPILIAVNPYKEITGLYTKRMVRTLILAQHSRR